MLENMWTGDLFAYEVAPSDKALSVYTASRALVSPYAWQISVSVQWYNKDYLGLINSLPRILHMTSLVILNSRSGGKET